MKKLIFLLMAVFSAFSLKAQDNNPVVNALKSGNAEQVSNYLDKILDIEFPNKDEVKSIGKNQAGIALKSFYDNNNIKGFELSSLRELNGVMYIAGKLTNSGEGYKLLIMLKTREGKPQIFRVRIS
jgi:hypothetical protein